jgi:amino acid transporter
VYQSIVLAHVLTAFAFVFAHGTSFFTIARLRRERHPDQLRLLLDVSKSSLNVANLAGIALILLGIWAGIEGGWWNNGRMWLWTAVIVLIIVIVLMTVLISRHTYPLRDALAKEPGPSPDDLERMLSTSQPMIGSVVGSLGPVVIIWLMMTKPF